MECWAAMDTFTLDMRESLLTPMRGPCYRIKPTSHNTEQTKGRHRIIGDVCKALGLSTPWSHCSFPLRLFSYMCQEMTLIFKIIEMRFSVTCSRNNHTWCSSFYLTGSICMSLSVFWCSLLFSQAVLPVLVPTLNCFNCFILCAGQLYYSVPCL